MICVPAAAVRNISAAAAHEIPSLATDTSKLVPMGSLGIKKNVMDSKPMKQLEKNIFKYLKQRGWDNLRPVDLAKSIIIEGAELLENFQWENLSLADVRKNRRKIKAIESELADVLIYAMEMAILLKLDTAKIIQQKLAKVKKKYPAKLMRANKNKEPGTQSEYWRIKKAHRRK